MVFLNIFVGGVNEGLLWALLSIGVFITFRQLDFADLTVEGSFATGGAVLAILATKGVDPFVGTLVAFLAGSLAGLMTGLLHTKLKIPPILAGILTMTALYSINMRIMGQKSNISLAGCDTIISIIQKGFHIDKIYATLIVGAFFAAILCAILYWFFGTQYGSSLRATGINEKMARAQGINTDSRKIFGLMLSNAVIALSGAMVAQSSNYADVTMGVGAIVAGLAAVIIGETIFAKARTFWMRLFSIVVGSIIYKVIIAFVISIDGFNPSDIKLITAIIVALALALPTIKNYSKRLIAKKKNQKMLAGGCAVGGCSQNNVMASQASDALQCDQSVANVQKDNNSAQNSNVATSENKASGNDEQSCIANGDCHNNTCCKDGKCKESFQKAKQSLLNCGAKIKNIFSKKEKTTKDSTPPQSKDSKEDNNA